MNELFENKDVVKALAELKARGEKPEAIARILKEKFDIPLSVSAIRDRVKNFTMTRGPDVQKQPEDTAQRRAYQKPSMPPLPAWKFGPLPAGNRW